MHISNYSYKYFGQICHKDFQNYIKKFIKEKYRNRDFAFKKKESHFANIL